MSKQTELLNLTDGLSVDSSGNVGIGTTAAAGFKLDVNGAFTVGGNFDAGANTNGGGVNIGFDTGTGGRISALDPAISWYPLDIAGSLLTFGTFGVENMRVDASGNLLVGTTTGSDRLNVSQASGGTICTLISGGTTGAYALQFKNPNGTVGNVTISGTTTSYNTSSDYRLKENITPVQGAADIVKAMRPCTYTFKFDGSWHDGFLAHELQELHPRAVTGEKDAMKDEEYEVIPTVLDDDGNVVTEAVMGTRSVPDYQGVDYSKLTPILTAALQEALNKIDALEARLTTLEAT